MRQMKQPKRSAPTTAEASGLCPRRRPHGAGNLKNVERRERRRGNVKRPPHGTDSFENTASQPVIEKFQNSYQVTFMFHIKSMLVSITFVFVVLQNRLIRLFC